MEIQNFKNHLKSIYKHQQVNVKIKNKNYNNILDLPIKYKGKDNMTFFFQNIGSLSNKINQIEILINQIDKHFNIIAFAETRKINEKMINIIKSTNSYEYVNPKLNRCGGLLLIINKEVEYTIKEEYKLNENTADDIWIEYNQNNKKTG